MGFKVRGLARCFDMQNEWFDQLSLLKDSVSDDKVFLKMVVDCFESCEFCLKFKKPFSRPVIRFPLSNRPNRFVIMDLKEVEKGKAWNNNFIEKHNCLFDQKKEKIVSSVSNSSVMTGLFWSTWYISWQSVMAENSQMMYYVKWSKN